jgi:hypothetical protein
MSAIIDLWNGLVTVSPKTVAISFCNCGYFAGELLLLFGRFVADSSGGFYGLAEGSFTILNLYSSKPVKVL